MSNITETTQSKSSTATINPMSLWKALLYFGLPALLFRISLYNGTPTLIRLGMHPFEAIVVSFTVPAAILFALAFGFYKRDGFPLSWGDIKTRFRLIPMTGKDWLWAIGGFLVTFLSIGALTGTALMLIDALPAIGPPDFFPPWLKPGVNFDTALFADYIGAPLKNNWGVAVLSRTPIHCTTTTEHLGRIHHSLTERDCPVDYSCYGAGNHVSCQLFA
jgi:hypothetical protein